MTFCYILTSKDEQPIVFSQIFTLIMYIVENAEYSYESAWLTLKGIHEDIKQQLKIGTAQVKVGSTYFDIERVKYYDRRYLKTKNE